MIYIDAEHLQDGLYNIKDGEIYKYKAKGGTVRAYELRDIVTCKECIHCADDWNGNQPMFTCELGRCGESVQPNDFCSYGQKGDENVETD